jgi:hypothetical protein
LVDPRQICGEFSTASNAQPLDGTPLDAGRTEIMSVLFVP